MFIKNNISCRDNFIFVRNSDFVNICEIVADEIIYIDMRIKLSLLILLQLSIFYHDIDSAIIDFQINYLRSFLNSEKVFFNIQIKDFVWCFSTLSFSRNLIVKIYSTINDFLSKIMWKTFRYLHYMHLFHDYILWAFCNIILILSVRHRKLKVNLLIL